MWLLFIVLLSGAVQTVEFNDEAACTSALISLNMAAVRHITDDGYTPHVDAYCTSLGGF